MANEDKKDFNAMLHDNKDMPKFQIIMEKLGGGGHLSNAATQIKGVTIEEAKQKLLDAIDEYEKENE